MTETQQCLQLGLPGNLEEMEYRKETKRKKIFFSIKTIQGLDFSPLIAHTSAPLQRGELNVLKK